MGGWGYCRSILGCRRTAVHTISNVAISEPGPWSGVCVWGGGGGGGGGIADLFLDAEQLYIQYLMWPSVNPALGCAGVGLGGEGFFYFIADLFLGAEQLYTQYLMWPSVNLALGVGGGRVGGIADLFFWVQENSCTHKI